MCNRKRSDTLADGADCDPRQLLQTMEAHPNIATFFASTNVCIEISEGTFYDPSLISSNSALSVSGCQKLLRVMCTFLLYLSALPFCRSCALAPYPYL